MSRPANVATGKCRDRQMSRPAEFQSANVAIGKCRDRQKVAYRQMSRPANVAIGKSPTGKSPTGEVSVGRCRTFRKWHIPTQKHPLFYWSFVINVHPFLSLNFPSSLSPWGSFNLNHHFEGKTSSFIRNLSSSIPPSKSLSDSIFVAIYFETVLQFCGILKKILPSKFNLIRSNRGQNPIF